MDQLTEIPHASLPDLRDLYKKDWPTNHVGYYTVDNYIRWLAVEPAIKNLNIYALNADWSDGTFLIVVSKFIFFSSKSPKITRFLHRLSRTVISCS
jgi:hypothetical protein